MILLGGKHAIGNILRVIVGPESEFWLDVHGAAVTDISELIRQFDPAQPSYISISRCRCEQDLQMDMQHAGDTMGIDLGALPQAGKPTAKLPPPITQPAAKPAPKSLAACSRCGQPSELVPKLEPPICYNCVKIDLYLAKKHGNIPPIVQPDTTEPK